MNKETISIISFVVGAAVSGCSTWLITKKIYEKKYSDLAQEEIDSVKKRFTVPIKTLKPKENTVEEKKVTADMATHKPNLTEYAKKIKEYTNYSNSKNEDDSPRIKDIRPVSEVIQVIDPEEYGDERDYDKIELTLYADGILADENDEIIDDVGAVVGPDALDRFGEYEDDAVHVKNDLRKAYYEVLADERSYEDATGKKPHDHGEED